MADASLTRKHAVLSCPVCKLTFVQNDWLPWRVRGFCSDQCGPEKPVKKKKARAHQP